MHIILLGGMNNFNVSIKILFIMVRLGTYVTSKHFQYGLIVKYFDMIF